jgi:histidine triad (HIT) family protein
MYRSIRNAIHYCALVLVKTRGGRYWLSWMLTHMNYTIPVHRLLDTETLVAFRHPNPDYPVHILLVPKKPIANLLELTPADQDFMIDLFRCVRELVQEHGLEQAGYRLIVNGGSYQEFPYLHFHLISSVSE